MRCDETPEPKKSVLTKRACGGAGVVDVAMSRAGSAAILRIMRAGNGGLGCGKDTVAELLNHTLGHFPALVRW